ncbi:unnamed protein product [Coregonus sp. 'balchen']|nr:unnamed protein product [Coregonus sp. 'balchen']
MNWIPCSSYLDSGINFNNFLSFSPNQPDSSGVHTLSGQGAAECGYTMVLDSWGDLVLRASYLACHVDNEKDTAFRLLVWFVNRDVDGEETSYPLQLTCPLRQPWKPREIVCEENYMEVSAMKEVPPANNKGLEWMTPPPVWSGEGLREWRVVFRVPGDQQGSDGSPYMKEKTLPVEMAHLLGYHINTTETRVLLRCAYGSRLAYILQASMDGKHVLWRFPKVLSPLVQPPFRDRGLRVGVEGRYLSDCVARQRGYDIQEQDGAVEIRIPFGAEETNPSEGQFSVSLGLFPPDVSLSNITVGDQSMAEQVGVYLSQVPFPNGTHAYLLKTPFSHRLVSQKYLGQGYRRYSLAVTFTLSISPHSDLYHYPATVEAVIQDVVLPRVEGGCSDKGVRLQLHYGNMDTQWEVYVGGRRLDWELVELGDYALESRQDYFSVVIPLYGLGMAYEGLTLQGLVVTVRVTVEDRETAIEEHTFTQRLCLPDSRMVVVVDISSVSSAVNPRLTSLLDPSCVPIETDGARALYSFSLDSCGTSTTLEEGDLVYTNEVRYRPKVPIDLKTLSSPYPHFR